MLPPAPRQAVTDGPFELAVVAALFPGFCIWRSVIAGRVRYIARALRLESTPYAVVCCDPGRAGSGALGWSAGGFRHRRSRR